MYTKLFRIFPPGATFALDRILPSTSGHPGWPLWLAVGRVYFVYVLQCPMEHFHQRKSAWHFFLSAGILGSFEYERGHATWVEQVENYMKTEKRFDPVRWAMPKGMYLSFITYGCAAGLFARAIGIEW